MKYTREQIQKAVESKGYKWFEGGDYNLNIVGIRNSETNGKVTNKFDDRISVSFSVDGELKYHDYACTTDPGSHWEKNLLNKDGVAILVPGQYRSSHKIRNHQGKYEAICQQKNVRVYRDKNKDGIYDFTEDSIQEGIFGINIHKAGGRVNGSTQIDKWSAGCQVLSTESDFDELMVIANKSKDRWSNSFTYTLIESKDII